MRAVLPGLFAVLATALLPAATGAGYAAAQTDPGAPPGAERTVDIVSEHDGYDLPVAPFGPGKQAVQRVEGAVRRAAWRLDDAAETVASIMRRYREHLEELGFEGVFACENRACGGFDFRFGAEILPPPGMRVDVRDFAQLSARRAAPEEFVSILVSRVLDTIHIQTVSVLSVGEPPPAPPDEPPTAADPVAAPEAETLPSEAKALLETLRSDGHVPVEGLEFDTGGTRLSPASSAALDGLARLLRGDETLMVAIVGHSDNQGPLDLNVDLSRRRAEAVMQALVERGVPAAQMEAHGLGYLAPVASNASEAGRAANRRVELVLR